MQQPSIQELDVVALVGDVPAQNLCRGQVGTVVHVYAPDTFEVEFVDSDGRTYALATLKAEQLLRLRYDPVAA